MASSRYFSPLLFVTPIALGFLTQPLPVSAQTNTDQTEAAQALIDGQKAGAAFHPYPYTAGRFVIHNWTGMECGFAKGAKAVLTLYTPDGKDVACEEEQSNGVTTSVYVRYAPQITLRSALASQLRTVIGWRWTSKPRRLETSVQRDNAKSIYGIRKIGLWGDVNGVRSIVRIAGFKTPQGWIFMQRFVAPLTVGGQVEGKPLADGFAKTDQAMLILAQEMKPDTGEVPPPPLCHFFDTPRP